MEVDNRLRRVFMSRFNLFLSWWDDVIIFWLDFVMINLDIQQRKKINKSIKKNKFIERLPQGR